MTRRQSLLVQLTLVGVVAVLAFPGASSALRPLLFISLTSNGPDPAVLTTPVGLGTISFQNIDTVTHSITFENGWCSGQVPPNGRLSCGFLHGVGDYAYTVDGTIVAHVVSEAVGRSVSLVANTHSIRRGSLVTLRGVLDEANAHWSPPGPGSPQPIIVIARPYADHPYHRVAIVRATLRSGKLRWHVDIHPRFGMTYVAIASYQPPGGQVWERAVSKPFRIDVHR